MDDLVTQIATQFIDTEKAYEDGIISEQVQNYIDVVSTSRSNKHMVGVFAQSESKLVKRMRALDLFDMIAAMERSAHIRTLDYKDYFTRQQEEFAHEQGLRKKRIDDLIAAIGLIT